MAPPPAEVTIKLVCVCVCVCVGLFSSLPAPNCTQSLAFADLLPFMFAASRGRGPRAVKGQGERWARTVKLRCKLFLPIPWRLVCKMCSNEDDEAAQCSVPSVP